MHQPSFICNVDLFLTVSVEKPSLSTLWFQKGFFSQLFLTGELLCVLRPFIYVLFIRRYGIQSWRPWLISLSIDLAGMSLLSHSTTRCPRSDDKYYQLSDSEKDEATSSYKCFINFHISNSFDNKLF